MVPAARLEHD
jgi:hypothetical protein